MAGLTKQQQKRQFWIKLVLIALAVMMITTLLAPLFTGN